MLSLNITLLFFFPFPLNAINDEENSFTPGSPAELVELPYKIGRKSWAFASATN